MRTRRVRALVVKDWLELSRNRQTLLPVLLLPIVLACLMPATLLAAAGDPENLASLGLLDTYLDQLPAAIASDPPRAVAQYLLAPVFLMIPVVVATVLATAAFVGEKERDTLEGLLFTPMTDRELVGAKILVTLVPSVAVTWVSLALYTAVVHLVARPGAHGWAFPTPTWLFLVLVVSPLVAFFAIGCIVLISHRASTLQGAQAVSGLLVLPVLLVALSQAAGALAFDTRMVLVVGAVALVADVLVFDRAVRRFDRDRVVTRL